MSNIFSSSLGEVWKKDEFYVAVKVNGSVEQYMVAVFNRMVPEAIRTVFTVPYLFVDKTATGQSIPLRVNIVVPDVETVSEAVEKIVEVIEEAKADWVVQQKNKEAS